MISIRPYAPADRPTLVQLITELQGHLASLDPLRRVRALQDFDASQYVDHLLAQLNKDNGVLFIAEEDGAPLGVIAGSMPSPSADDSLGHYPVKEGKVNELVVSEKHREKGAGRMLMETLEKYCKEQHCGYLRVGCFASNTGAHVFYEKCGYGDRSIEMLKKLGCATMDA